ncbi:MAG: mycothiol transferase, partial [Cellulosimicrobium cellulans]
LGYVHAVQVESQDVLAALTDEDLDRVVDEAWDPPVTLGVRLVSVAVDSLQHAGQAAYVRGVLERTGRA